MPCYGLFCTESPYPNLQWRFHSEHYFCGTLHFCIIAHYDITNGNDIARDVHCDIMGHDVMGTYPDATMHTDVARTLMFYVLL